MPGNSGVTHRLEAGRARCLLSVAADRFWWPSSLLRNYNLLPTNVQFQFQFQVSCGHSVMLFHFPQCCLFLWISVSLTCQSLLLMTPNESPSSVTKGWEWASCAWVLWCSHKREFNNYICHTCCPCWLATWRYQGTLWSNIQIIGLKLLGCRMEEPRQDQFLEPDAFLEGQCSGYFVF